MVVYVFDLIFKFNKNFKVEKEKSMIKNIDYKKEDLKNDIDNRKIEIKHYLNENMTIH